MVHQALSNFFSTLQVDCTHMDVEILKQTSHEFQDISSVNNVGNALSEDNNLNKIRSSFQSYFQTLNQFPLNISSLSEYYEMVLMVLVQCDLNHKYIQLIQQLQSQDQIYLKNLIENLFGKLTVQPVVSTDGDSKLKNELYDLQIKYSKLNEENEDLKRQLGSVQNNVSNNKLHNDLSLAEDKINDLDIMIQKQTSIITDLTGKLQFQSNLQQSNTSLKQDIEELKHKLIKFKKMEQNNILLNKKVENFNELEANVKHLEQVNQELINQLKGEPQQYTKDSILQQENQQLQIHQIQIQEELRTTLDQLSLLEQEKQSQMEYIQQLEDKLNEKHNATESPPSSAEMLRQVDPTYTQVNQETNEYKQLKAEHKYLNDKLLAQQSQFQLKLDKYEKDKQILMETVNSLKKIVNEPINNTDVEQLNRKQAQLDEIKIKFKDYVSTTQQEQRIMFGLLHNIARQQLGKAVGNDNEKTISWLTEQRRLLQQHLLRS
eukprot:NODE_181_length_15774_cov_0.163892.p2 type:complete len:490 gc:universal NODE_181_length_15774_cov_0.163892:2435-966(-)